MSRIGPLGSGRVVVCFCVRWTACWGLEAPNPAREEEEEEEAEEQKDPTQSVGVPKRRT